MGPTAVGRETRTRTFRDMGKSTDTGAIQAPPRGVAMAMICRWYQRTVSSRPSGVLLGGLGRLCFHPTESSSSERVRPVSERDVAIFSPFTESSHFAFFLQLLALRVDLLYRVRVGT